MQDGVHSQYVESAEARKSDNDCGTFNAIAKRGEIDGIKDEEARQISDSREEPIREDYPRPLPPTVPLGLPLHIQEETTGQSKCELDLVRPVNICSCLKATRLINL